MMTMDGISYEKEALFHHCKTTGPIDPITRNNFGYGILIENKALKQAVEHFIEKEPWAYDSDQIFDYNQVIL